MLSPQKPIDACFRALGIDAILDPDGVSKAVRVLPSQRDRQSGFGSMDIVDVSGVYEIRASDWVGFQSGALISVNGQRRIVQGEPETVDAHRLIVELNTFEEGA